MTNLDRGSSSERDEEALNSRSLLLQEDSMNIPPDSSSENESEQIYSEGEAAIKKSSKTSFVPPASVVDGSTKCSHHLCPKNDEPPSSTTSKFCHKCCAYYCSRQCRRLHWKKHKSVCDKLKATKLIEQILVKDNREFMSSVSSVARRGAKSIGRGAVKVFFPSISAAEGFLSEGVVPPTHYQPVQNIMPQEVDIKTYERILELCRNYDIKRKFVLYICICTSTDYTASKPCVAKCTSFELLHSSSDTKSSS